jgi:RND family efflux transporter MFP subunit
MFSTVKAYIFGGLKSIAAFPGAILRWVRKHWILSLVIVAVVAGGGYWYYKQQQANKPVITFKQVEQKNLTKTLDVSGKVDAGEKARLRFLAGGKLTYLGVKAGDTVKKWQTLARIDVRTLQKQLEVDLNTYMRERWDWEQTLDDTKDRALPKREVRSKDKEQWNLEDTVTAVEIRDIAIRDANLTSPINGIVTVAPTTVPGVQMTAADYFEVIDPTTLKFIATVDETDIAQVKLGQAARLELDAFPDEFNDVTVSYIAYTSSQTSTATVFLVEFTLDPTRFGLDRVRLGMNGDVSITIDTRQNVLTIPLEATRERDGKTYVDVKTGEDTFEERAIEVGMETDDDVEVISGLTLQDSIVIPTE